MTALALTIDYASLPTPASAFLDFVAALANVQRNVKSAVKDANEKMDVVERQLHVYIDSLARSLDLGERAIAAGFPLEADQLLEIAQKAEEKVRREAAQVESTVTQLERMLHRHFRPFAKSIAPVIQRYRDVAEWYTGEIQDGRWRVMAMRADLHRDEKGPVFSDPKSLSRYLASIG